MVLVSVLSRDLKDYTGEFRHSGSPWRVGEGGEGQKWVRKTFVVFFEVEGHRTPHYTGRRDSVPP